LAQALEVKWQTDPLPNNGLVALNSLPSPLVERVQQLLVHLHEQPEGQQILQRMELSRFEIADDATYQPVREFVDRFSREVRPVP
jgi:phosphonate transport system substrate-binding protein